MLNPHQSGHLGGCSEKHPPRRRAKSLRHFPDVPMTDAWRIKREVPDFEEGVDYTQRELHLLAEKILLVDPKDSHDHPAYLPMGQFRERQKREVYVATGVPDPSWVSGMYWRTHPEGRTFQTKDNTNSFYR